MRARRRDRVLPAPGRDLAQRQPETADAPDARVSHTRVRRQTSGSHNPEDPTVIVGYARVSTQDQDLSAQLDALKKAGTASVYREKISGARADRPQLFKLMASLRKGDVVIITKIDRLARSTRELLNLIHQIDQAGASVKSLGDPLFNTANAQGRLLVAVLGAVAEFERELIRDRTGEGRKRAMANGVRFGRKPKLTDHQRREAITRRGAGETLAAIAKSYAVSISMISRLSP
jgi:DNA invertase Pin-like site-specific DNA recombinase